jgi:outer membrane protein assembly factor BamB
MFLTYQKVLFALGVLGLSSFGAAGQDDPRSRISPEQINIRVGEERSLQLLDDSAQELSGAEWFLDHPEIADLREQEGREILHANAPGVVIVTAVWAAETRTREIHIWPAEKPQPQGTIRWSTHDIGREINSLAAVPGGGANMFTLEQTDAGKTYLRAFTDDGFQLWSWLAPEETHDIEFVCGDWLSGAVIGANREDSFTLYFVGPNGQLRWRYEANSVRKGLAIDTDNTLYLVDQSRDRTTARFTAFDESSGAKKFELPIPSSVEKQVGIQRRGSTFTCAEGTTSTPLAGAVSSIMVNMDGFPYVAFREDSNILGTSQCTPGSKVEPKDIFLDRDNKLVLWQIHRDGTYRATIVEEMKDSQPFSAVSYTGSPTKAIVTDNMNGMLVPAEWSQETGTSALGKGDDVIYRVSAEGRVVYKLSMPSYSGPLHDDMVIGEVT